MHLFSFESALTKRMLNSCIQVGFQLRLLTTHFMMSKFFIVNRQNLDVVTRSSSDFRKSRVREREREIKKKRTQAAVAAAGLWV